MSPINELRFEYSIDVVICLDATNRNSNFNEVIKQRILSCYNEFEIESIDRDIEEFRIKIITFKNFVVNNEPIKESKFFSFKEEKEQLFKYIDNINFTNQVNDENNALEAFVTAMNSNWTQASHIKRHVILLFSDSQAVELEKHKNSEYYPKDMPKNLTELQDLWENKMSRRAKRFFAVTPDKTINDRMVEFSNTFVLETISEEDISSVIRLCLGGL